MSKKLLDLEIMVKCVIRGAVSLAELKEHYGNDPLTCAESLADNDQGLCGTIDCETFTIVDAKVKQ